MLGIFFSSLYCFVRTQTHIDHCHYYQRTNHTDSGTFTFEFLYPALYYYTLIFFIAFESLYFILYFLFAFHSIMYRICCYEILFLLLCLLIIWKTLNSIFLALVIITFKFKVFFILK